jgi:trigger factor
LAKVESAGANKVKLTVEIAPEAFAEALQQAYIKTRGKYTIQGFRKGHAPRPMIERHYGEGVFFEEAFDIVFPESYQKAVEELELAPVSRPELDIEKIGKAEGVVYTAEVFVKPEVKLGQYKGVTAEEIKAVVEDSQVQKQLEQAAERNARWVDVEREAKEGDKTVIDYSGSVDGVKFDGGTAENQTIELGSHTFIPGFEEQILGMKSEEETDITVKFPDDYRAEHLAGKEAVFHVKLHDVKEKELPAIDDEFAQDVSEFDTLEEYKESIKKHLLEHAEEHAKADTEKNVLAEVVKNAEADIPECMIENQIDHQIRQLEYSMMYQGMKLVDYLQMTGTKIEDVRKDYHESAEKSVRTQLVVEAVMKAEDIKATDEQVEEEIKKGAERAKKDIEEYRKSIDADELEYIRDSVAYDNTVRFLVENAKFTAEGKKADKKAAEKKSAAKKDKKDAPEKENPEGESNSIE